MLPEKTVDICFCCLARRLENSLLPLLGEKPEKQDLFASLLALCSLVCRDVRDLDDPSDLYRCQSYTVQHIVRCTQSSH